MTEEQPCSRQFVQNMSHICWDSTQICRYSASDSMQAKGGRPSPTALFTSTMQLGPPGEISQLVHCRQNFEIVICWNWLSYVSFGRHDALDCSMLKLLVCCFQSASECWLESRREPNDRPTYLHILVRFKVQGGMRIWILEPQFLLGRTGLLVK